jgi:hypothetical protein
VIDNLTLVKDGVAIPQLLKAKGKPMEVNGIMYSPKYSNGEIIRYEAQLKNLRLFVYPSKMYLVNSLHKYWHNGYNHTDFNLLDAHNAIEDISIKTGINWFDAKVKSLEVGCNILANPTSAIDALHSYKGKNYVPMLKGSTKYGSKCSFDLYSVKLYNKQFEVKQTAKIDIGKPLVRWELVMSAKYFNRFKLTEILTFEKLLNPHFFQLIINEAIAIFKNTIKVQTVNYSKLKLNEVRALSCMINLNGKEQIKNNHKNTYKTDRKIFNAIMKDRNKCFDENTGELIEQKFKELVTASTAKKGSLKKGMYQLVV